MLGSKISSYFQNPTNNLEQQKSFLSGLQGSSTSSPLGTTDSDWMKIFGESSDYQPQSLQEIYPKFGQVSTFDSENFNTNNFPDNSQLFPKINEEPKWPSDSLDLSSEIQSSEGVSDEAASVVADSASSVIPSLAVGAAASGLFSAISSSRSTSQQIQADQGNGPNAHAFDAAQHAQMQSNLNSEFSAARTAAITVGSAFGPEGLVAGLGVAGLTAAAQYAFPSISTPDENTTMSTGGTLVNAAISN